mgnify:CR=1 FL=1
MEPACVKNGLAVARPSKKRLNSSTFWRAELCDAVVLVYVTQPCNAGRQADKCLARGRVPVYGQGIAVGSCDGVTVKSHWQGMVLCLSGSQAMPGIDSRLSRSLRG